MLLFSLLMPLRHAIFAAAIIFRRYHAALIFFVIAIIYCFAIDVDFLLFFRLSRHYFDFFAATPPYHYFAFAY